MPTYRYKGRGKNKELLEDTYEALNIDEAMQQLTRQGITLIKIFPDKGNDILGELLRYKFGKPTVKIQELIMFCRQMSSLTKAGISLVVSIKRLGEVSQNPTFQATLQGIERGILTGQSLASCLKHYPEVFPQLFVEIIALGEESGKLDEGFSQIGGYLMLEYETRKRIKSTLRYPIMVVCTILAAIVVINIFVIPNFAKLYGSFRTELPLPTQIMIGFSNFLRNYGVYLLGVLLGVVFLVRSYINTHKGKLAWHRLQFKLPIVGGTFEKIVLSRFARTLAIVFISGVPLEKGLTLVGGAVGNAYAKDRILEMREHIQNGENLSRAASETHLFSPLILQMIAVGEETGSMDNMLSEIATFYEREVDYDIEMLGERIEPVLLLIVASMVLMLAVAVFLPMWNIYQFTQGSH
jgi:MSHA biogenesis protein MshG